MTKLDRSRLTRPSSEMSGVRWASAGRQLGTEHGELAGPFNALVQAPEVGRGLTALGATLRFGTSIERRLSEVTIITIGARWKAEFEWWAHARMARAHGVQDAVVNAIGQGEDPLFAAEYERIVHAVASELGQAGNLQHSTYAAAHELLGGTGMWS